MAVYNLIGCRRCYNVIDAIQLLAERKNSACRCFTASVLALLKIFRQGFAQNERKYKQWT